MADQANTVRRSFSLDALEDHKILEWLAKQDNVSETIRAALRAAMGQPSPRDVLLALDGLATQVEEVLRVLRSTDVPTATADESVPQSNLAKMVTRWKNESEG